MQYGVGLAPALRLRLKFVSLSFLHWTETFLENLNGYPLAKIPLTYHFDRLA